MTEEAKVKKQKERPRRYGSMKRRWILNSLSFTIAVILLAVTIICGASTQYYYSSMQTSLLNRANSTAQLMNVFLNRSFEEFYENGASFVNQFAEKEKLELQLVDSTGRVMFSSAGITAGFIPTTGDVAQCLDGNTTIVWIGINESTGERVMSASAPVGYGGSGQVIGAVRYCTSLVKADRQLKNIWLAAGLVALGVFGLVFLSNYYFIRSIVNPVLRLNNVARSIAAGSYGIQMENDSNDEIGELCDSINYMSDQIARSEKMKNDIISSISHELRTPLTSIGGWTETLMVGGMEDRGLALKGLAIINKESHRLSQMVEELLDFARLEGGRMQLHSERFDLRGELADAAFIYTDLCKRDGITMQYDEGEEPVPVFGDKDRLRQVFLNILDNAAKYSGPGGKIELAVGRERDKALAVIRDHGPGIPAADLPYIKDKFYRGAAPKKRGAGIGLSVCDEIVKLHGGTLTIDSQEGEGTCVSIRLPLAPAEKPPEA